MSKRLPQQHNLHVLFTGLFLPDVLSGGDQLIFDIIPRLPENINVTIITPHFTQKRWEAISRPNITYHYLPPNPFDFKTNPLAVFMTYAIRSVQVYKILKKDSSLENLYSCSDVAYADIWPAFLLSRKRPKVKWISRIYHVLLPPRERHGNYLSNTIAFYLQRLSFQLMKRRSSVIFALNDKLYNEVLALGFPKKNLSILGAGIDFELIRSHKSSKKYPYDVVVLGRVAPVKGIFDTIEIWEKVHEAVPNAKLGWIGSGGKNMHDKISSILSEKGLSSTFKLLGFVDKNVAFDALRSAKIFLCPDHENGWGLAVSEAMASGLPVISYDLDIFGGVYKKGYVSCRLYDTLAFADNIISLLRDPKRRDRIASDAISQASEFDHDKVIDTLMRHL